MASRRQALNSEILQENWSSLPRQGSDNPWVQSCYGFRLLFSHSVMSNSVAPWAPACQASLSFTITQSLLKLRSIELVMPSNHLILCHPLLLLPSIFPSIRVFSNGLFMSGGQCIGASASASVLPMDLGVQISSCFSPGPDGAGGSRALQNSASPGFMPHLACSPTPPAI